MARPFYSKFVWKDWLAKTFDLTANEYVAYHRMLTWAATNSPDLCSVPADDNRLRRITGLHGNAWLAAKPRVLQFWEQHPDPFGNMKLVSNRLRIEAGNWFQLIEKQRRAACIRHSQTDAISDIRSKKSERIKRRTPLPPNRSLPLAERVSDFEKVWEAYPHFQRRSLRPKSLQRWKSLNPYPSISEVMKGLTEAKLADDWTKEGGQFVPGLQVWIRDRGWESSAGGQSNLALVDDGKDEVQRRIEARIRELEGS